MRLAAVSLAVALAASTAFPYSHFVRYTSRTAPYNPVAEKFDLAALPNRTVTFFVSDQSTEQISRPELYTSALAAVRDAAKVWNSVPTSELRVAFGGPVSVGTPQNTPGADIVFDEMDPLLLGVTTTNAVDNVIARPIVRLNRNLGAWATPTSRPSFTEAFFLTVVHEMGHALGLQHTFTASAMSTEITRATSLSQPLTADDAAGISALYPAPSFAQSTGSISGRVTLQTGQGVHLASVVAIRASGTAVSALTEPDGRYRIDGVPAGTYYVYAHPLPPGARAGVAPGDLSLPLDVDGRPLGAEGPFDTLFFRAGTAGTRDHSLADLVAVEPGQLVESVNMTPNRRTTHSIPSVTMYSYFGNLPVRPAFLNDTGALIAGGPGLLTSSGAVTPGLSISFLGGTPVLRPDVALQPYSGFVLMYLNLPSTFGGVGPRAMIFSLPDDIYVLPAALRLTESRPPFLSAISAAADGLAVTGTNLSSQTRFFFDGAEGRFLRVDGDRLIVAPPAATAGRQAAVTAFSADGQNSAFLQSSPAAAYESGDAGAISLSTNALSAGTETMIEVAGTSGAFAEGFTTLGFNSSDIQVRQVWVSGANRVRANVWVSANTAASAVSATVLNGLQIVSQPFALQILPQNPRTPVLNPALTNALPPLAGAFPGATVNLSGANLTGGAITVGGRTATIVSATPARITLVVPPGLPAGPAVLTFANGTDTVSVIVTIDGLPPEIRAVAGDSLTASITRAGATIALTVANLGDAPADASRVRVTIGGVQHPAISITPDGQAYQIRVALDASVAPGLAVVTVSVDGRSSAPFTITVAP